MPVLLYRPPHCDRYCLGYCSYKRKRIPPAAIAMTGPIYVWRACEVELESTYRNSGSKDWDASLVSNLRSHTLSHIVLATILQIG